MKTINKFLFEFSPSHPLEIVIKNKYYPRGLTELQIYNYYLSVKNKILEWIGDRRISFLLRLNPNKTILIRNQKGKPIYLNNGNYDDLITGRTNVIYVTQDALTDEFVIDIDIGTNLNMNHAKKALEILLHSNLNLKKSEAINSSDRGIHLISHVSIPENIEILKKELEITLKKICDKVNLKSKIKFLVNQKGRSPNTINFDLSSMNENSLHIAKYSLTKEFLICSDIKEGIKKIRI